MRNVFFVLLTVLCEAVALAMPSKQEIGKAQPLVAELMAPVMSDFKAKKKTAAEVADAAVAYAAEAETEAAKFMLYRSSIPYYVKGEAYDKAAEAVTLLKANVKGVPAEVVAEIISKATVRANKEKAPRLFELYQQAKTQATAEKDIVAFRAKLRKNSGSLPIIRNLAEALATSGDWDAALKEFAKLKDGAAQIAKKELGGSAKSAELGEFWWAYSPTYENAEDTFKIHAAVYYRKALAAGEITGLKKPIVEQRIKEYADLAPSAEPCVLGEVFQLPKTGRGPEIALKVISDCELNFISCPSGTFTMGFRNGNSCLKKHKVCISRPFWISKFFITYAQWDAFMYKMSRRKAEHCQFCLDVLGDDQTPVALSYNQALEFLDKLNGRFKKCLPIGYVFRLASEAECEYVVKSGRSDYNAKYDAEGEVVSFKERLEAVQNKGYSVPDWERCPWRVPYFAVGSRKANKWGVHDMLTSGWMYVLDRVKATCGTDTEVLTPFYENGSVDPVQICEEPDAWGLVRGCGWGYDGKCQGRGWIKFLVKLGDVVHDDCFLRIVIGPDLVSEWKAKHGKK